MIITRSPHPCKHVLRTCPIKRQGQSNDYGDDNYDDEDDCDDDSDDDNDDDDYDDAMMAMTTMSGNDDQTGHYDESDDDRSERTDVDGVPDTGSVTYDDTYNMGDSCV